MQADRLTSPSGPLVNSDIVSKSSPSLRLPGRLVDAEWLDAHIGLPDLVVLDATVPYSLTGPDGSLGLSRWRQGHVPGSRYADLQGSLSDADASFSFTFPPAEHLARAFQALGIHDGAVVIVYDDFLSMWATRVWWMLRAVGFYNVAVLDGGWKGWVAAGKPVVSDETLPVVEVASLSVNLHPSFVDITAVAPQIVAGQPDRALVCALPESYFAGIDHIGGRGGHIPGSISIPAASLLDEAGRFLPEAELRSRLARLDHASPIIIYCGSGISATLVAFALGLAGREDVRVYDGSLEEWNADPLRPLVAQG